MKTTSSYTLTLKPLPEEAFGKAHEATAVAAQIKRVPKEGVSVDFMRDALRVSAIFEAIEPGAGEVAVELTEKDYGVLQRKMEAARWPVIHEALIDLTERCMSAVKSKKAADQ